MAEEEILQANTDFGAQVIAARDKPTPEITIDNIPMDEFIRNEREGLNQPEQGTDIRGLFDEPEAAANLFRTPPAHSGPAPDIRANRAYSETLIFDDPASYDARKAQAQDGTVQDHALMGIREEQFKQGVADSGALAPEFFDPLTPEEKIETVSREMRRLNLREVSNLNFLLMTALSQGGGQHSMTDFEAKWRQVPVSAVSERLEWVARQQRATARKEVDATVAQLGFESFGDGVTDIIVQDMIPIQALLSRWKLLDGLAKAGGIEINGGFGGIWLGELRQSMREELTKLSPAEFTAAAENMGQYIEQLRADPVTSKFITKYGILEVYEAVFTEDVFDGASAANNWDRWGGNMETLLEGLFSVVVVAKGAKTLYGAYTATGQMAARNAARGSGNPKIAGRLDEALQTDDLAIEFGIQADDAVPALLPRPSVFVNNIEELPDGVKDTVIRSERHRSEILDTTGGLTGEGLTVQDRTNTVNRAITDLDINDGAHVHGKMSTLRMFDDESGYQMQVVVGETAERGYKNIDDVMDEALDIDPNLEQVNIMRVNGDGVLEPVFEDSAAFARAVVKGEVDAPTAGRIAGGDTPDETFYITYDREHFWHSVDKEVFGPQAFQSAGYIPRALLSPNAKFGDEIYGSFLRAYMGEQTITRNFDILFEPYYKLGQEDKKFVASAFEWMEDFGKDHGRAPDVNEMLAHYDGMTEAQVKGAIALRTGMDTMHELFNRRLYRDWQGIGYKTARPANNEMPTFHGKELDRADAGGGEVLDPELGTMVKLSGGDLDSLYNAGGRIMELDMAVDAANEARKQATRILLKEGTYEVGELSTRPLKYHPGYSMRFYDDPYYIVKETEGISLNGSVRNGATSTSTEAIRTAGTAAEAARFVRRATRSEQERGTQGVSFKVVRGNDLQQSESTLFQKQAIHREGRLFWDERNVERLPDVNGNRAKLEDPVKSLERGIGQAARQLTHEDLLKTVKEAWKNDYGHMLDADTLQRFELKEISQRLKKLAANTVDKKVRGNIKQAREVMDYLRMVEGTEQMVLPALREAALNMAVAVNRWTGQKWKGLEKAAMTMDPGRAMKSVAFNTFLVFRPVRQALLQSSQIGYLAALEPAYVASTAIFRDSYALRRGLTALRKSGYDDGFSVKSMAKAMGITEKEYRVLIREFDRSGLVDLVDVHSFAGGAARFKKVPGPAKNSTAGTIGYRGRQMAAGTRDFFQKWGFDFGEKNNLTFTYALALRRAMRRNDYKKITEMSKLDWKNLKVEASNLALGMVRPNNFGYQTGAISVATQFLSFGHKAALGLVGGNPAIKGKDALKIILGTQLLYGANMYGGRDFAEQALVDIGVSDQNIPGTNVSLVDVVSAGIVDNTFNMLGDLTVEDWKDVDLGFIAPGLDFPRLFDMQLRNIMTQPTKVVFGPFGNIASNTLEAFDMVEKIHTGDPDLPAADKFMRSADLLASAIMPAYNDNAKAYLGYKMGIWYSTSNEALPLRTTYNGLVARGLFGARTKEELSYYNLQRAFWEDESDFRQVVNENRKFFKTMVSLYYDGVATKEQVHQRIGALVNWWEDMPEGVRTEMMMQSMEGIEQDDLIQDSVYKQIVDKALANPRFDPAQIDHLVDRFTDIPPEKREQLRSLLKEAHDSRVYVDSKALEQLEDGN